ncbi:CCR4-NOT transcription complex subunit 10 isoform X3 [Daktulosphaira vitifoliae]|uniref:CCR4-NOT transcription complex subunit 10 isoform X1 n=1 Tax=Daktulosphaira vitifoliae TaxID=58002 RepID=UPI0021AA928E|nr:CCR4-NOT transcription complex subunit 10 isoform X1 [Daktulosphaira vitifoliae]XP_050537484.1 CCR4-NOT transcription complex subunit 10 isoform X2 [Daktulosphaira vitifoliae]XP_050537485.1 CCR4-NOT transcription complex subunit 10 isoform X3 [Daktulosphaira vitifoliae]
MAEKGDQQIDKSTAPTNITDQERDWAQQALAEYEQKNFKACMEYLKQIEAVRSNDPKVMLNKAIVEFYENGLCTTDKFRKAFTEVCTQVDINLELLGSLDDVENCIYYYNYAVLLYHLKYFNKALNVINIVYAFIESLEESLAHKVCLLIVQLHLDTQKPMKALKLISYIESQFVSTENATNILTGSGEQGGPIHNEPDKTEKKTNLDAATDAFRISLIQYRVRCLMELNQFEECIQQIDTIKEKQDPVTLLLMGKLEYLRGHHKEALEILKEIHQTDSFKETGVCSNVLVNNNVACLYHYAKKPTLAYTSIYKALVQHQKSLKEVTKANHVEGALSGQPLHVIGASVKTELMFNLGISLLHAQKPEEAFDCLIEAVQTYHMNPRLWLRLAECCIMTHKSSNERDFDFKKPYIEGVVGSGIHRKIILKSQLFPDTKYSSEAVSAAVPMPSLEFGSLCIRNAAILIKKDSIDYSPSHTPVDNDIHYIFGCIQSAGAYIALCLGDPIVALKYSQELLEYNTVNKVHKFLGHLYAAEALILLDKPNEAIDMLKESSALDDLQPELQEQLTSDNWKPDKQKSAKAVLYYNLAVALTLRGDLDKAGELLKQIWLSKIEHVSVPVHVVILALYIHLRLGQKEIAITLIKQNCPQAKR